MQQPLDEDYANYLSRLHSTLEVLSSSAQEQCEAMGAYNASWELQHDGIDFAEAVLSLGNGKLDELAATRLRALRDTLKSLPAEAVTPEGHNIRTVEGCLVALSHPSWATVRTMAASCLLLVDDPFA